MSNSNIDAIQLLNSILGNGAMSKGSGASILQAVLGGLGGMQQQQVQQPAAQPGQSGGLNDLLNSSGLGGLLGAVLGGGQPEAQPQQSQQMPQQSGYRPAVNVTPSEAHNQAALLIRAMCNAAKADGKLDQNEQQAILSKLGNVSQQEIDFIRQELATPLDVQSFARSIPRGLEQQVYVVSLMAIDLDTNPEAQYLHQLAQSTGINPQVCNQIHQQLGAPLIYR